MKSQPWDIDVQDWFIFYLALLPYGLPTVFLSSQFSFSTESYLALQKRKFQLLYVIIRSGNHKWKHLKFLTCFTASSKRSTNVCLAISWLPDEELAMFFSFCSRLTVRVNYNKKNNKKCTIKKNIQIKTRKSKIVPYWARGVLNLSLWYFMLL